MRNINKISLLTLGILLFGNNCFAQIKFDVTSTVSSVTDEVGKIQEQAQDIMKQGEHMQTFLKMKDGLTEGLNKIKDIKSQVMDVAGEIKGAVDDAKGAIDEAKGMAEDAKGAIDGAKGMVNDAKDMAGGALESAQGTVSNATGGLSQAKDMLQLQNQMAQAESNYENRVQNINAEKEAALQKLRENNEILQQMLAEAQGTSASAETSVVQASESAVSVSSRLGDSALDKTVSLDTAKTVAVGEKVLVSQDKIKADSIDVKPTVSDVSAKVSITTDKLSMNKAVVGEVLSVEKTAQPLTSSVTSGVLNRKAFTQPSAVQTVTESVKVREAL